MKASKIIIILIVLTIIGTGLLVFQKNKQKKDLITHKQKQFELIIKAAGKSNSAGMLLMASAIKKYHIEKGRYPAKLTHLYPDYLQDMKFITALNWQYSLKKNNFQLKRSLKGSKAYAAIDASLRLQSGFSIDTQSKKMIASVSKPDALQPPVIKTIAIPEKSESNNPAGINAMASNKVKPRSHGINAYKFAEPEFVLVKKALHPSEAFLKSFKDQNLFIWKNSDGVLGFSNVQYPQSKKVAIFRDNNWIQYKYNKKNSSES